MLASLQRRGASLVLAVAGVSVAFRLWIASSTFGSDDVHFWTQFAAGVDRWGPIGIYGHHFSAQYNHPPLSGWMLFAIDHLRWTGLSFPFLVRVPACLADGITGVLLFVLLQRHGDGRAAVPAALIFLLSPVAVIVSGFHGNTDPVFVMLALAALHQEKTHGRHFLAGVLLALSISVKIVPVLLLPLFLVRLVSGGRRGRLLFLAGAAIVFAVLWGPPLVERPGQLIDNVLLYAGTGADIWGLPLIAIMMGLDPIRFQALIHASSYLALAAGALLPVMLGRRLPGVDLARFGLAVGLFLLMSPAFGMQYLVWPLAAAFLVGLRYATAYAAASSVFALTVYSLWNHALPWNWYEARSFGFSTPVVLLMLVAWLSLLGVVLHGVSRLRIPAMAVAAGDRLAFADGDVEVVHSVRSPSLNGAFDVEGHRTGASRP